ncbi:hypothetical protein MAR_008288 [Mya arenaria]|uniref:Uncharacterized protein n=1 Tax=Mya arenaria TaxID=6604 RepID=A0ABY7DVI8_MYAAR|nr:hypothetical protein MAR_008288 [Mya arenaria]
MAEKKKKKRAKIVDRIVSDGHLAVSLEVPADSGTTEHNDPLPGPSATPSPTNCEQDLPPTKVKEKRNSLSAGTRDKKRSKTKSKVQFRRDSFESVAILIM